MGLGSKNKIPTARKIHVASENVIHVRCLFSSFFLRSKEIKIQNTVGTPRGERKQVKTENERERERVFKISSLSSFSLLRGLSGLREEDISVGRRMQAFDRVTIPMRRVWTGVSSRFGVRKSGLLKLRKDVSSCEYNDVQVMWEMLRRNETEVRSPRRCKRRTLSNCLEWARRAPFLCRSF